MSGGALVFYALATLAVVSGAGVVLQRNALYSALSLVTSMVALALLFIQLGSPFLGAIQVIVYAGAIMVLFVFIIMLLNLANGRGRDVTHVPGKALGFLLMTVVFVAIYTSLRSVGGVLAPAPEGFGTVESVGRSLFGEYVLPFELAGVLLFVAIVGTVVLARKRS